MPPDPSAYTRRELLHRGLLLASASVAAPAFLQSSALAMQAAMHGLTSAPGVPEDHILVVVQLSGGNDGLNTVVPFAADEYYKARSGIAIAERDVLALGNKSGYGLHPALNGLKGLYDEGLVGIVHGVGYPNPNRSHFKSMDIWHTADTTATGNGWLGKYFDSECCGFGKGESGKSEEPDTSQGPPGIAIGRSAPLAMEGGRIRPVSFENADLFRWTGVDVDKDLAGSYDALNRRPAQGESNADFLLRTALDAQVSSDLIRKAVAQKSLATYPQGPPGSLGQQLSMVASMIRAGLKTRVYYVTHGSFDTHSGQGGAQGRHAQLLRMFGDSMKAFYEDLKKQDNDTRVLTMVFSEFGRRVGQNASQGTDHGTAAPMFLLGPVARQGLIGDHPNLRDLDEGDLKFTLDFRSVYAGILEQWMKADSKAILGATFKPAVVVRKA